MKTARNKADISVKEAWITLTTQAHETVHHGLVAAAQNVVRLHRVAGQSMEIDIMPRDGDINEVVANR